MSYKWSNYNLLVNKNYDSVVIFNTQSGAICELENEIYSKYTTSEIVNNSMPYFNELVDLEILENDETNQNDLYDNESLTIVISCTEDCNLQCYYCFEKKSRNCFFEGNNTSNLCNLIDSMLLKNFYKNLHIIWFGGEPLLYAKNILEFSQTLIEICQKYRVIYSASIVTNGTLLSAPLISQLIKAKICKIQITFDGNIDLFKKNKRGTNSQWENLLSLLPKVIDSFDVTLRFNIDHSNIQSVKELLLIFKNMNILQNCKIRFAQIHLPLDMHKNCLSYSEFCVVKLSLISYITFELGVVNESIFDDLESRDCACAIIKQHGISIDANGRLYKCEDLIGQGSDVSLDSPLCECILKVLEDDTNLDNNCLLCSIFPLCKGECPIYWVKENCIEKKDYIKKLAALKIRSRK